MRKGQTVTGSRATSMTGTSWAVASSLASTWNVTGSTFSDTAPALALLPENEPGSSRRGRLAFVPASDRSGRRRG